MKLEFSRQSFEKYSNIKFHENLPGGNRGQTDVQRNVRKLIVAFSNFGNAPKNWNCKSLWK